MATTIMISGKRSAVMTAEKLDVEGLLIGSSYVGIKGLSCVAKIAIYLLLWGLIYISAKTVVTLTAFALWGVIKGIQGSQA